MLIIEGPDGVGKTTLCRVLCEKLPTHIYCHFSRLPYGFDYYWGYVDRMSRRIIQDRFHMSEIVYATARGEQPEIGYETYSLLDAKVRQMGSYTLILGGTPALIEKRWKENPDRQMYNLERTIKTGELFTEIGLQQSAKHGLRNIDNPTLWDLYTPDFDRYIQVSENDPYVSQSVIVDIVERYRERQDHIDRLLRRRPEHL